MGDYFQTIVDTEVTGAEAAATAAGVLVWLVEEGVVGPERTEPVLGAGPGHPAGPRARTAVDSSGWSEPWTAGGLEIVTTRTVFDIGQCAEVAGADCPRCGATTVFLDEETWEEAPGAWDPFAAAMTAWSEGAEGDVRCGYCAAVSPLPAWTGGMEEVFGFGALGFTFWNWPDLAPAFRAEFGRRLGGHRTLWLSGKL